MPRVDNEQFYAASLKQHGISAQGVQWRSPQNQQIRFEQIAALLEEGEIDVVDAGCGFGDFYLYLRRERGEGVGYLGIDSIETMARIASRRTGRAVLRRDILHDPLPQGDYYVCSGALNLLTPYESHRFIRRCYEASRKGFVFNFLEGEDLSATYNYLLERTLRSLARDLGARCVFRRGYLAEDCTAAFYRF